jgi:hypothetical protein
MMAIVTFCSELEPAAAFGGGEFHESTGFEKEKLARRLPGLRLPAIMPCAEFPDHLVSEKSI